ncbi:SET domain-containing protein [Panus rudis PR-1116 ss-1]|nr:SET domain-containing protein [Panus rudis PR-1116 ss-1]
MNPGEELLRHAVISIKKENPTIGIGKVHALLLSQHPDWSVSEKRTRKVLQNEGLVQCAPQTHGEAKQKGAIIPKSKLIEGLDLSKYSAKIEVKFFDKQRGKGLIAKERIVEGETVWKEDPFILAPEWDLFDLQRNSAACAHCSTPLSRGSPLIVECSGGALTPSCPAQFCNRLCLSRSSKTHPLLCPARNPASIPLLNFARKNEWMALHALAQCTARVLLSFQQDETTFRGDLDICRSLASLGLEERVKVGWLGGGAEPDHATWKRAFQLYVQAFDEPYSEAEKKKLAKILRKRIPSELKGEFFEYNAFLWGLGRMSLNLEAHGGLYVLHSHLNHSCAPNVSVRHLDQKTTLSRITIIAKRDIEPGEELLITYVNPALPFQERRRQLLEWGFGTCRCARCQDEEKDSQVDDTPASQTGLGDLEKELKAGLGVM